MPIKYIGSKRALVPLILDAIRSVCRVGTVIDLFSGTARVASALKAGGYRVLANDHNAYAEVIARCYVQADRERWDAEASRWIAELNALPGEPGYFTETFCVRSRFFHPKNGARVDAIRERIAATSLHPELEAILLVSLMEAADRVDSTTGLQMAYLKDWAPRAHNDIELRVPDLAPRPAAGACQAFGLDAIRAARDVLTGDVAYLDPPYNQHRYLSNYHIWESLVLWDKPEVYGVACKRVDCRTRKSAFNSKRDAWDAMRLLIESVRAPNLVVSFNDEGFFDREALCDLLGTRGVVTVIERDVKRYVGAQIGIHDPSGRLVGEVSHLRNKEFLFVVTPTSVPLDRLVHVGDAEPSPPGS